MRGGDGEADEPRLAHAPALADQVGGHHRFAVPGRQSVDGAQHNGETEGDQAEAHRQVVAGDESFIPEADQVVATLGVGKVYVGVQPTGIADVTIIVGKDFGAH